MPHAPLPPTRILLCASAAHCAQVLHAAIQARINLHGLQPRTHWPAPPPASLLLWALLPAGASAEHMALEAQWRSQFLGWDSGGTVQMLYGSATQQARQLTPWVPACSDHPTTDAVLLHCLECLDAFSERQLFQHLLQRTQTS